MLYIHFQCQIIATFFKTFEPLELRFHIVYGFSIYKTYA